MAQLPDELLSILDQKFPCRQQQIRALTALISPDIAPCRNCIVYGTEATGKSAVTEALLEQLRDSGPTAGSGSPSFQYAIVTSVECVTGRHLFETTVRKVASALGFHDSVARCESLAQLNFELSRMLKHVTPESRHFVLVFDAIDRQKEAPSTLLPALARLSEMIPNLTTVFIMTSPPPGCLRTSSVAHVHFPNYTKTEFVMLLSATPPMPLPNTTASETADLWVRFCGAVHDALTSSAARTLPAFRSACDSLWPRFTVPLREGNLGPRDFTKMLIAARVHFQDESLIDPGIIGRPPHHHGDARPAAKRPGERTTKAPGEGGIATPQASTASLATLLPTTARVLLIAAYLASHNTVRHDLILFSTHHHGRRRRRGGAALPVAAAGQRGKHRKIARKLLGAHAFVLERMMAIFITVRHEWGIGVSGGAAAGDVSAPDAGVDADVGMALATLSSLRLLVRVGVGGDPLDRGGKWRVNVGWEVIRSLGRSMHVEVEEWLVE